jgi:hypothetical protein
MLFTVSSVAELHNFDADPASSKNFDAASDPGSALLRYFVSQHCKSNKSLQIFVRDFL